VSFVNGFSRLTVTETRLFLRERVAALALFGLPVALVIGFGMIPGFGKPQKGLSDQIGTEYIAGLGVAIVLATLGLNGVPMVIAQYRERGILRRLGVTPVRPLTLLVAKLMVYAAVAIVSVALLVAVTRIAFHVPVPALAGWFVISLLLGIASLFALGMLVAGVAPNARTATGLGWLLFFPNMFFAGVYFPTEDMSPGMRQIGDFTPLGAALHAVRDSWMGIEPRAEYLGIMAAYAVTAGALAARFFRWEQA
jgi:ABC-2 type transport system permease protein